MKLRNLTVTLLAVLAVTATACGGDDPAAPEDPVSPAAGSPAETQLNVAPASFDLAVGDDRRFLAGLFTSDRNLVLGGEVEMQFFYLGDEAGSQTPEPVATTTGTFLPVPGKEPAEPLTTPTAVAPADASGVYETTVAFDRAGFWGVGIRVELDDGRDLQGTATFPVAETAQVPAVGDPAPAVDNLTIDSDVTPTAIDSRAQGDDPEIPDPQLHRTTVGEAIAQGRPAVVVISTPTYCVSQFCGPITETIEELADEYADAAEFVHIEVWGDFEAKQLNEAAAAWIQTEEGGNEPWVFLVDADGAIAARWDNVLDEAELVDLLDGLASS